MVVLFFADVFGKPGRRAVRAALPQLRTKYKPDFVIANVENLAGGRGINRRTLEEMTALNFDVFTSGNHIWDNKEVYAIMDGETRLLRPANYPSPPNYPCPGRGHGVFRSGNKELVVANLMGRVFMDSIDCPFRAIDAILADNGGARPVLVDMHADATSEMYAMGWHLAGRAAAIVGSHSHVQTADERILPGGTAYITDVGMTGSFDSVIGIKPTEVIRRFMTKRPQKTEAASANPGVSCVVITISEDTKKATSIERLRFSVGVDELANERDLE